MPKKYSIDQFTIFDDFMFKAVFEDIEICTKFLTELLAPIKVVKVSPSTRVLTEHKAKSVYGSHGVRFDVLLDAGDTIYDLEMQVTDEKNLPQRIRYYQSALDLDSLKPGQDYKDIRNTIIVFICAFDPVGAGDLAYFKSSYYTSPDGPKLLKAYNDGSYVYFVNGACTNSETMKGLQEFVTYAQTGRVPVSCANNSASLATMVSKRVTEVKHANGSEEATMTVTEQIRAEGREEGRDEALAGVFAHMAKSMSAEEISRQTGTTIEVVRRILGLTEKSSVRKMQL